LRLFSFGGYGLALAALALVDFGAIECPPFHALAWPDVPYCTYEPRRGGAAGRRPSAVSNRPAIRRPQTSHKDGR